MKKLLSAMMNDKKQGLEVDCPNRINPHHECNDYCLEKYGLLSDDDNHEDQDDPAAVKITEQNLIESDDEEETLSLAPELTQKLDQAKGLFNDIIQSYRKLSEELQKKRVAYQEATNEAEEICPAVDLILEKSSFVPEENRQAIEDIKLAYTSLLSELAAEIKQTELECQEYKSIYEDIRRINDEEIDMVCPICMDKKRTHVISCGHFLCQNCMNRQPTKIHDGTKKGVCPFCQKLYTHKYARKLYF